MVACTRTHLRGRRARDGLDSEVWGPTCSEAWYLAVSRYREARAVASARAAVEDVGAQDELLARDHISRLVQHGGGPQEGPRRGGGRALPRGQAAERGEAAVKQLRPLGAPARKHPGAVARSREARLRAVEHSLLARLAYLRRHGRDEYNALIALLCRVLVARQSRRGR